MDSKHMHGESAEAPGAAARPGKATADRAPFAGPKPDKNTTTPEREEKAYRLEHAARTWIACNTDAWAFMASRALCEVTAKRRFGMKQLVEEARRKDFADACGGRTVIDNTISPALARILIEEHPEVQRFMETRRSVVDEAGL